MPASRARRGKPAPRRARWRCGRLRGSSRAHQLPPDSGVAASWVTEGEGPGPRSTEVQLNVVLEHEAVAAVKMEAVARGPVGYLTGVEVRHLSQPWSEIRLVVESPCCLSRQQDRALRRSRTVG